MQRWIVPAVIAVVVLGIAGAGVVYAIWNHKQNLPTRSYIPLPLNPELSEEQREQIAAEVKKRVSEQPVLVSIARDSGLTQALEFPSDEAAADFLGERLIVEAGEVDTPTGPVATLNAGFRCKVKEFEAVGKSAARLNEEIREMFGLDKTAEPVPAATAY